MTPKHAVLRDGPRWEGARTERLAPEPGGALGLARMPGAPEGDEVDLPGPWAVAPSGLAVDGRGRTFAADTDGDRVLVLDGACGARIALSGLGFDRPRGLVISGARLFVADSGNARIQVFRLPSLRIDDVWQGGLAAPGDLAADAEGRIYVADAGLGRILRLSPRGAPDLVWNAAAAGHAPITAPRFVAVDDAGRVWLSDEDARAVVGLDARGDLVAVLDGLAAAHPAALIARGDRLVVADAGSGELRAWDLGSGLDLGPVPGFRGPVTALAAAPAALLVKTDARAGVASLSWDGGCARRGVLVAGPLDAGAAQTWERVHVSGRDPTGIELSVHLQAGPAPAPVAASWQTAASLDTLVPLPPADGSAEGPSARHLFVRVVLTSADGRRGPLLEQVEASTTATSYLEDLPAVYARRDAAEGAGFLRRWLALFRGQLGDEERLLDEMARRFDPRMTPASWLDWLSSWVAMVLPDRADEEADRALIEAAHEIHTRRGTAAGLREAVHRETGLDVQIREAHRERRIWQLGVTSRLGADTALPALSPTGVVVPEPGEGVVVGSYVVGEAGPLEASDRVTPLIDETAHLFTVVLAPGVCVDDQTWARLREVLDAEKPAHTDYHLCQVGVRMRVGFQARIGVDSLVAGATPPMRLEGVRLGIDSVLGDAAEGDPGGRVGASARIGRDTVLA